MLTRDQAVEEAGRLRVQHSSGLTGILMRLDWQDDTCTASIDGVRETRLTAPRSEWTPLAAAKAGAAC